MSNFYGENDMVENNSVDVLDGSCTKADIVEKVNLLLYARWDHAEAINTLAYDLEELRPDEEDVTEKTTDLQQELAKLSEIAYELATENQQLKYKCEEEDELLKHLLIFVERSLRLSEEVGEPNDHNALVRDLPSWFIDAHICTIVAGLNSLEWRQ